MRGRGRIQHLPDPMTHLISSRCAGGKGTASGVRQAWVQISAPAFPGGVTLGKSPPFSELQVHHHLNGAITVPTSQGCYDCK